MLERCNQARNFLARKAWQTQKFRQFGLHKLAYRDRCDMFDLTAQAAVHCIAQRGRCLQDNRDFNPTPTM
jgi:putative transposase